MSVSERVSHRVDVAVPPASSARWAEELERGNILFFPRMPFQLLDEDRAFLLEQKQTQAGYHKNIAYRPAEGRLTGAGKMPAQDAARLTARNDLAHVDAFPTRPTHGDRILRVFVNLNPAEDRVWITSETFEGLAERFARQVGIPKAAGGAQVFGKMARALGIRQWSRSPYDAFMLRFHDFLKENAEFQRDCTKQHWEFPPGSCWICYTDMVSHAVLSGRFALEQTFLISRQAMALPEKSPIRILERICGHPLAN